MLEEREAVADAARVEQDGIEEVLVCGVAVAECLARVKEERNIEALFDTPLLEPEDFGYEVLQWTTEVFLSNKVETGDEVWMGFLDVYALLHRLQALSFNFFAYTHTILR
jgi:hypothetical protein